MAKVYAIIIDQGVVGANAPPADPTIFVPIKATLSPYPPNPRAQWFCPDLPQCFGGDAGQNPNNALIRELREESQDNIVFNPNPFQLNAQIPTNRYNFYVLHGNTRVNVAFVPSTTVNNVSIFHLAQQGAAGMPQNWPNAWYEYRYILRIPNTVFAPNVGQLPNNAAFHNRLYERSARGLVRLCHDAINPIPQGLERAVLSPNGLGALHPDGGVITETAVAFNTFLAGGYGF
jgi:hypothetical protein